MSIKTHDQTGFVVEASKFGASLFEGRFEYALFGELTEFGKAAVRNGVSQWIGDAHASDTVDEHGSKEAAIAAAIESCKNKAAAILRGEIPRQGGGRARLNPFDRALRELVVDWLAKGMTRTKALKMVSDDGIDGAVLRMAEAYVAKNGGDAVEIANKKIDDFTTAAKAIVEKKVEATGEF